MLQERQLFTLIKILYHLCRLREADKRTVFSVLKKSERDKKKLMETVLRQLRQLLQSSAWWKDKLSVVFACLLRNDKNPVPWECAVFRFQFVHWSPALLLFFFPVCFVDFSLIPELSSHTLPPFSSKRFDQLWSSRFRVQIRIATLLLFSCCFELSAPLPPIHIICCILTDPCWSTCTEHILK